SSPQEITHLFATVYKLLGEAPTRLLLRKYGELTPEMILQFPMWDEVRAQAPSIPADQKLSWMVREICRVCNELWAPLSVTEDEQAVHLHVRQCPVCGEIRGVRAPICADGESMCGTVIKEITGLTVRVVETACIAMGDATCTHTFYK